MIEPKHISDIYSYFKTVNTLVHTPSISINTDNIRPKLLFEVRHLAIIVYESFRMNLEKSEQIPMRFRSLRATLRN